MRSMHRIAPLLLAGSLLLLPTLVLGHTELTGSDPVDGSTLTDAPGEVVLTFAGELDDDATFTVVGPDGEEVGAGSLDLQVADRNVLRGTVEIGASGAYTVAWSVAGEDGHDVEGEVAFTYEPEAASTAPDTALPVGGPSAAVLVGALLIVLALTIPARRTLAARR